MKYFENALKKLDEYVRDESKSYEAYDAIYELCRKANEWYEKGNKSRGNMWSSRYQVMLSRYHQAVEDWSSISK